MSRNGDLPFFERENLRLIFWGFLPSRDRPGSFLRPRDTNRQGSPWYPLSLSLLSLVQRLFPPGQGFSPKRVCFGLVHGRLG